MDEALMRANLEVSKSLRVRDGAGAEFVVSLVPASDPLVPRPRFVRWNPAEDLDHISILVSRAMRFARRDRRWRVQLESGRETPVLVGAPLSSRGEAAQFAASYIVDRGLNVLPNALD